MEKKRHRLDESGGCSTTKQRNNEPQAIDNDGMPKQQDCNLKFI